MSTLLIFYKIILCRKMDAESGEYMILVSNTCFYLRKEDAFFIVSQKMFYSEKYNSAP